MADFLGYVIFSTSSHNVSLLSLSLLSSLLFLSLCIFISLLFSSLLSFLSCLFSCLLSSLLFSCLLVSCLVSSLSSSLLSLPLSSFPVSLSVSLCLCLYVFPCSVVCDDVLLCCCVWLWLWSCLCMWCGTLKTFVCGFTTPPFENPKRPRVCRHHVHMYKTCAGAGTHGGV